METTKILLYKSSRATLSMLIGSMLLLLGTISACSTGVSQPTVDIAPPLIIHTTVPVSLTPVPSGTPTTTPTPVLVTDFLQTKYSNANGKYFKIQTPYAQLPSGLNYLYTTTSNPSLIKYFNVEQRQTGNFVLLTNLSPASDNTTNMLKLTGESTSPSIRSISVKEAERKNSEGKSVKVFEELSSYHYDILNDEFFLLEGKVNRDKDTFCTNYEFSDDYMTAGWSCLLETGQNVIYTLNLNSGEGKLLVPPEEVCQNDESEWKWYYFNWSADQRWMTASCMDKYSERKPVTCIMSLGEGEFSCKTPYPGRVIQITSNAEKFVLIKNDSNDVEGNSVFVTDRECLYEDGECNEQLHFDFTAMFGSMLWDEARQELLIAEYDPVDDGSGGITEGITDIKSVDVLTGEARSIALGPRGASLVSISPDGNWVQLKKNEAYGYFLMSRDGGNFLMLEDVLGEETNFVGWLYKP